MLQTQPFAVLGTKPFAALVRFARPRSIEPEPKESPAMPNTRTANAVRLEFTPGSLVQINLSGAAFSGDWLWVSGDEACGIDRLRRLPAVGEEALRFGDLLDLPLTELLDLPEAADEEADGGGRRLAVDRRLARL